MKIRKLMLVAFVGAIVSSGITSSAEFTPTRGDNAIYTLTKDAGSSNTGKSVTIPTYDKNGKITGTENKYLNINKTQYSDGKIQYTLDENTGALVPAYTTGEGTGVNYLLKDGIFSGTAIGSGSTAYGFYLNNKQGETTAIGSEITKSVFMNNKITIDYITENPNGTSTTQTGLIYNAGIIDAIYADFIGNSSIGTVNGEANSNNKIYGTGIWNQWGTISKIVGDFIGNSGGSGSAIYNGYYANIGLIKGNFIGNTHYKDGWDYGGAIYNNGTIDSIEGSFIGNSGRWVGAICNNERGIINSISGEFIGNDSRAIYNTTHGYGGKIGSISGDFINNKTAIDSYGDIDKISGNFINNTNHAIYTNAGIIQEIEGNFIGNKNSAIEAYSFGKIGSIKGNFIENTADTYGGAIYDEGSYDLTVEGNFRGNTVGSTTGSSYYIPQGGAIYKQQGDLIINDSSFIDNKALDSSSSGGAIVYTGYYGNKVNGNVIINAINKDVLFSGNQANVGAAIRYNDIGKIVLNATGGNITFENNGPAENQFVFLNNKNALTGIYSKGGLEMNAFSGKTIQINDKILIEGTTSVNGGTVALGKNAATTTFETFDIVGDTILDLRNSNAGDVITVGTLTGDGNLKLNTDYDGLTSTMDKITVNAGSGTITLNNINILTDSLDNSATTTVYLDGEARNNVNVISEAIKEIVSSGGKKYTFTPDASTPGVLTVTVTGEGNQGGEGGQVVEDNSLSGLIAKATGVNSFTITEDDYAPFKIAKYDGNYYSSLGTLSGNNREFTIFGGNKSIDGTLMAGGKGDGITVNNNQILNVENISEFKNFTTAIDNSGTVNISNTTFKDNNVDINNTGKVNFSGTNTIKKIQGANGTVAINDGTTTIAQGGDITQKSIALNGANLVVERANVNSEVIGNGANRIDNQGTIEKVSGNFIGNSTSGKGGAIFNYTGIISSIKADFIENTADRGGAIYDESFSFTVEGDFRDNVATDEFGGAIRKASSGKLIVNDSSFIGNKALRSI